MTVNYILMYGTPYLRYKPFETFYDISKFLVKNKITNYRIYEIMDDLKECEMIHLENDVHVLEKRIKKAVEEIKYFELQADHLDDNIYLDKTLSNKLLEILKGNEK